MSGHIQNLNVYGHLNKVSQDVMFCGSSLFVIGLMFEVSQTRIDLTVMQYIETIYITVKQSLSHDKH